MSQTISGRFAVCLQWEPLLGLEREAREIRNLTQSRGATHYVVFAGELGARTLGLATAAQPSPDEGPALYALAPLVASGTGHKSFLFVHPHPDEPDSLIVIGVREDRPELDIVVPVTQAEATVKRYLKEKDGALVELIGEWPQIPAALKLTEVVSLNALIDKAARGKLSDFALAPSKRPPYRPQRNHVIAALVVAVVTVAAVAWHMQPEKVIEVDPVESFMTRLQRTLAMDTAQGGASHATALQETINSIIVDMHGWRVDGIVCEKTQCTLSRTRSTGADVQALLASDSEVVLDDLTHATQIIHFKPLPTPTERGGKTDDVVPAAMTDFYKSAVARMQSLSDFGLTPTIGLPEPVVPVPASISNSSSLDIIKRGDWSLNGELAFIDSMTGIVVRSGNMLIKRLTINLDSNSPTFHATGTYYVK